MLSGAISDLKFEIAMTWEKAILNMKFEI